MRIQRPLIRGIRLRLSLALVLVVAGVLGVVYLVVVPSLQAELVNAKLDQLEQDARTVARSYLTDLGREQDFAAQASALFSARVVLYTKLESIVLIQGDSSTTDSRDVERDPIAERAATTGKLQRGTVERDARLYAEVALPAGPEAVVLLSDSLADPLSSLHLIQRRLLLAGLIGLLFAVVAGYALATSTPAESGGSSALPNESPAAPSTSRSWMPVTTSWASSRRRSSDARPARDARSGAPRVHRERLARVADAALLARRLSRVDGGRGDRRGDSARVPRDDAGTGRPPGEARRGPARPLRLDAGRMRVQHEPVDLGVVAQLVAEEFAPVAERNDHSLEVVVEGSPIARADELRVLQVCRALVDNALVHTPPGTKVTLRAYADREHAYLEVEDDGPGVPLEHAPHVFDRFYRAEGGVASGSGLGLAIARELVTFMDGNVELESEPGHTVLRVVLGAAPTSVAAPSVGERVST